MSSSSAQNATGAALSAYLPLHGACVQQITLVKSIASTAARF